MNRKNGAQIIFIPVQSDVNYEVKIFKKRMMPQYLTKFSHIVVKLSRATFCMQFASLFCLIFVIAFKSGLPISLSPTSYIICEHFLILFSQQNVIALL